MARIEIRRENDARRAEVPSPKGPVSERQKVPCPVDKKWLNSCLKFDEFDFREKMFHELERSSDFVYCLIIFVPYALSNFNNH